MSCVDIWRPARRPHGLAAGLRDPYVGRALAACHRNPSRAWTIESLARQAVCQRSALAERFTQFIGQPPMVPDQLARCNSPRIICWEEWRAWRPLPIAWIYESEAAFSRTFKRVVGAPRANGASADSKPTVTSPENAVANPSASRHALAFIFITMLVDTIGLGIIIPVTPKLIVELTGGGMSEAARWGGWLFFVYALMQFLCAPAIGGLSDRFGRRPVLILALAMLGVDYLITAMAPTILWLFIGRFLSGVAGAAYPTANDIADTSPPEKRARTSV